MEDISSLKKKLAGYSALAAATLALAAEKSDGQIVYTDIDPDFNSTFNQANSYHLDMNNDGTYDFTVHSQVHYHIHYGGYYTYYVSVENNNSNQVAGVFPGYWAWLSASAWALNFNDEIGSNLTWQSGGFMGGTYDDQFSIGGIWLDVSNKYLGLKFFVDGNAYYGWARLDVYDKPNRMFKILDYAYNSIPNQFILAGQKDLPCSDSYEPNDTKNSATQIQTNQVYQALINTSLDIDWFSFTITAAQPNVRVQLFNLPANFNLFLYNANSVKLDDSKNGNTKPDTVIANSLTPGTYYVKVRGASGKFDPTYCYSLIAETSAVPWRMESPSHLLNTDSRFELYPNPVSDKLNIRCDDEAISIASLAILNLLGQKISEQKEISFNDNSNATIDVSQLPAGEYLLQIKFSSGMVMKKIEVMRQ